MLTRTSEHPLSGVTKLPQTHRGRVVEPATPSGMLHSARHSHGAAFSCAIGLPLTISRVACTQDNPGNSQLLFGTYKVFRARKNENLSIRTDRRARRILDSSVSERRKDPDFIRAFVAGILLVKPVGRNHHLDLMYMGSGWYKLKSLPSLSGARLLASWSLTSPSTVFTIWKHSFLELSRRYSDQILWLLSNWSASFPTKLGEGFLTQKEAKLQSGTNKEGLRNILRKYFARYDTTLHVGHSRSSANQSFQLWSLRSGSWDVTAPRRSRSARQLNEHSPVIQDNPVLRKHNCVNTLPSNGFCPVGSGSKLSLDLLL